MLLRSARSAAEECAECARYECKGPENAEAKWGRRDQREPEAAHLVPPTACSKLVDFLSSSADVCSFWMDEFVRWTNLLDSVCGQIARGRRNVTVRAANTRVASTRSGFRHVGQRCKQPRQPVAMAGGQPYRRLRLQR